uniref:Uncharacterized protein n=1 Tax=Brassica campestris TaxID=3711 RepID=A0A3P6CQX0_BRACM|nr:unnamed protein product [Brassica rapa]
MSVDMILLDAKGVVEAKVSTQLLPFSYALFGFLPLFIKIKFKFFDMRKKYGCLLLHPQSDNSDQLSQGAMEDALICILTQDAPLIL